MIIQLLNYPKNVAFFLIVANIYIPGTVADISRMSLSYQLSRDKSIPFPHDRQLISIRRDRRDPANRYTSFSDTMIWGVGKVDAYSAAQALISSGTEERALPDISVYPNPASEVLTIDAEGVESVQLVNTIGHVCLTSDTEEKPILFFVRIWSQQ